MTPSLGTPRLIAACLALGAAAATRADTPPAPASPTPPAAKQPAAAATPATTSADPFQSSPIFAPVQPAATDDTSVKHPRVMSDEIAGALAPSMPKYAPPPKPAEPVATGEGADLREVNKPKNRIIRLPTYMVTESKPPVFRDRDLYSKEKRTDISLEKNPGLKVGNLFNLNRPIALLMADEKERLENIADLKDEARNAKASGDNAAADFITRENIRANYRPTDFGWDSDGGGK